MGVRVSDIEVQRRDNVVLIRLARLSARNALDLENMSALLNIVEDLHQDSELKAVMLQGQPGFFCAGGDVAYFRDLCALPKESRRPLLETYIGTAQNVIRSLARLSCPLIVCLDGTAAGYGLSLACLADQVVASERAVLLPAYTAIAATPDGGLSYFLPHILGERQALNWVLYNQPMPLTQALSVGLINELHQASAYEPRIDALIASLNASPRHSFASTKQLLRQQNWAQLDKQLAAELEAFIGNALQDDFCEGIAAFFAKRTAVYA